MEGTATITPLRVLLVEDSADDAELLIRELRQSSYAPYARRVSDAASLTEALAGADWDLILSDYTLPGFRGTEALTLVRRLGLDIPFIVVSGTISDEIAVAAMRAGANDYVVKDNLKRLAPAIERELREAEGRRERARAVAGRAAAEARFSEILAMAPDAIVAVDQDQRITLFNHAAEAMFGYTADEARGRPLDLLIPGDVADRHRGLLDAFAGGPEPARRGDQRPQVTGVRRDGTTFTAEASISKLVEDGATTSMVILRDISQRLLLEEQLRQAQKMEAVGQLTGGIAHDFNNLLTIVVGNLDVLGDLLHDNPEAMELTDLAMGASLRGAEMTQKLLAFSRRQSLAAKAFDLNALVADTVELLRPTIGEHIIIEVRADPALRPVLADAAQVESALVNLAINARDAIERHGTLTIRTASRVVAGSDAAGPDDLAPGTYVLLEVTDTGSGIPPEVVDRVFEPFFTTKAEGKGTGLGLSMVYGFAKQSGGDVEIESTPGQGTTMRVILPAAAGTATSAGR